MANIARRDDPFNDFEDLFRGFFLRPMQPGAGLSSRGMKVDISKTDDTYRVKAEMPGVPKDKINVSIDGNEVTITGEVEEEKEAKKGEEVIRTERYYGRMSRSFSLPHEVDESKADAQYKDGVLELTLPKKSKSATRRLEVH